jgi:serine/threonine protein kinase
MLSRSIHERSTCSPLSLSLLPCPLSSDCSKVPRPVIDLLRRMLQADPAKRITAEEALRSAALGGVDANTMYGPRMHWYSYFSQGLSPHRASLSKSKCSPGSTLSHRALSILV